MLKPHFGLPRVPWMAPTFILKSTATSWALIGFILIILNTAYSFEAALVIHPNTTRLYGHYPITLKTSMTRMINSSTHPMMNPPLLLPLLCGTRTTHGAASHAPSTR